MNPKEGDRVITADNLKPGGWTADMLRRRKPDTRGTVQQIRGTVYTVAHDGMIGANRTAQYCGHELQLCPTEETELDKLFRRVVACERRLEQLAVSPSVLQAYQGLHREATAWWSAFDALRTRGDRRVAIEELSCAEENLHDALQTLEELGVRPGQTSGPEPQLYRRVCQALHVDEDSMPISELADLIMGRCQLHDRLSDPGAYGIEDPAALANVALAARESVQGLTTEVEILKRAHDNCAAEIVELLDVPATTADGDKMGIAELIPCIEELARTQRELAEKLELTAVGIRELTDAPPDVDHRDALEAAANRIAPVTHLLECYGPRELRGVAAGLYGLCDSTSSPVYAIADAITTIAVMADGYPSHEPDSLAGLRGTGPAKASSR
jgi:hypothetical protein